MQVSALYLSEHCRIAWEQKFVSSRFISSQCCDALGELMRYCRWTAHKTGHMMTILINADGKDESHLNACTKFYKWKWPTCRMNSTEQHLVACAEETKKIQLVTLWQALTVLSSLSFYVLMSTLHCDSTIHMEAAIFGHMRVPCIACLLMYASSVAY